MISIIVPIYKVEKYLPKCIESILNQTYHELQIILVDDGSPDNSPQICDEYAKKDSRIIVIHQKNRGVSAARNAGVKAATSEYIGFVDPDDYLHPEMYEKMFRVMQEDKADLTICGYDYIEENGEVSRAYRIRENEVLTQKDYLRMQFDMPPTVRHGVVNKLFKKELFEDISFPEYLSSSEDVWVTSEYAKRINKAVFIHQPLYKNLVRQGSATHGGLNVKKLSDSYEAHNKMHEDAIQLYPELKDYSMAFLLDVCLLKYDEVQRKNSMLSAEEKKVNKDAIMRMKKYIKKNAIRNIFNREIYWKTRITYLLIR